MGNLAPIAFDIETDGLGPNAIITVAGLALELGEVVILNTGGRAVSPSRLERQMNEHSAGRADLRVCENEEALLTVLAEVCDEQIRSDGHYLTAFNGEMWNGGFDLPFVRTACVAHDVRWPFPDMAYADMLDVVKRFDTGETRDLVGVYEKLIGEESCDTFEESEQAVDAFENGDWESLLLHNLADIQRTRELAVLASEYVPKSDFRMKNLAPPK